jgi:predicted signal transduction protein with EAL and GGDEF domain
MDFWRFTSIDPTISEPLKGGFDPLLVLLSIVIASFAGMTALMLADRMASSPCRSIRTWWHWGGAVAMGCGIWAMHFTGMLAFSLPMSMSYDLLLTLLSLVPAILGSAAALHFMAQPSLHGYQLHLGALLMALGIGTMHYTGMEAMRMEGLRYHFLLFCLSIVVAHVLAVSALYIHFSLRKSLVLHESVITVVAGAVMGHAVAGMHYTAMGASRFYDLSGMPMHGTQFSDSAMAITIGGFAGIILALSMLAAWMDRQKGIQRTLEQLAHTDALTGLPNRVQFRLQLEDALRRSQRSGKRLAVLFLDLNDFKTINDGLGHAVGDRVLREFGERLQFSLRSEDTVARWRNDSGASWREDTVARFGGDEFIAIIQNLTEPKEAVEATERLHRAFQAPFEVDDWRLHLSASIGISIYPDDSETPDDLIKQADAAMYRAKAHGIGYRFFDRELTDEAVDRVRMENKLRDALQQQQLTFHFQPWNDLESGQVLGLEALARWFHPEDGNISPARFIPIAERSALIIEFGQWALRHLCEQGKTWLDSGFNFKRIAVNIAVPHLAQENFVPQLQTILAESGLPADRLELEITESSLMVNGRETIQRLHDIRALGVTLAVDDFGTGFSSLSYLKDLPINKLKIDRAFVKGITDDPRDAAIICAVVEMGAKLGFDVLAEGIEIEEQRAILLQLGCPQGQGFLFGKPASVEVIESDPFSWRPRSKAAFS